MKNSLFFQAFGQVRLPTRTLPAWLGMFFSVIGGLGRKKDCLRVLETRPIVCDWIKENSTTVESVQEERKVN